MSRFEDILRAQVAHVRGASDEVFEFFGETKSPFSQGYTCDFTALPLATVAGFESMLRYSSAEQFMMVHKALVCNDTESATKIMATHNPREQEALGRAIENFDSAKWDAVKVRVVYEGNKSKFTQNPDLMKSLLATQGKTLVEAAPDDAIWGIGLAKDDARAQQQATWLGTNLLGLVLTALRIEASGTY